MKLFFRSNKLKSIRCSKVLFLYAFYASVVIPSFSQKDTSRITLNAQVVGKDTLPVVILKPYDVAEKPDPDAMYKLNKINRMIVNVKTVLPYARLAKTTLHQIESALDTMKNEKDKKAYVKKLETDLKARFSDELKNLNVDQGRILIKLIDRETGNTTYALVKELRGGLSAFLWQSVARLFGNNLKTKYDSLGEDKAIENVIRQLDSGITKPVIPQ